MLVKKLLLCQEGTWKAGCKEQFSASESICYHSCFDAATHCSSRHNESQVSVLTAAANSYLPNFKDKLF